MKGLWIEIGTGRQGEITDQSLPWAKQVRHREISLIYYPSPQTRDNEKWSYCYTSFWLKLHRFLSPHSWLCYPSGATIVTDGLCLYLGSHHWHFVGHGRNFWQLLIEATLVAYLLLQPGHTNQILQFMYYITGANTNFVTGQASNYSFPLWCTSFAQVTVWKCGAPIFPKASQQDWAFLTTECL